MELERLREIRINGDVRPAEVVRLGTQLLEGSSNLGNEGWSVKEQVAVAGIDEYDAQVVSKYFKQIKEKFPLSKRQKRLQGMISEAQGKLKDATVLFKELSRDDPTDLVSQKRAIAILKAQGNTAECVASLNQHLRFFMADEEAWHELCDLYLHSLQFHYALFCLEEVMIADRWNIFVYSKYADILYSSGTKEDLLAARKYYSYSLSIDHSTKNLKALYSLTLTCSTISIEHPKERNDHNTSLHRWAQGQLLECYKEESPKKVPFVRAFLATVQL